MNDFLTIYVFCVLGIIISVAIPVLRQALPSPSGELSGLTGVGPRIWKIAKPYLVLALFSLLVGLLVVAVLKDQLTDWTSALLAGYTSDSTIQKLKS